MTTYVSINFHCLSPALGIHSLKLTNWIGRKWHPTLICISLNSNEVKFSFQIHVAHFYFLFGELSMYPHRALMFFSLYMLEISHPFAICYLIY